MITLGAGDIWKAGWRSSTGCLRNDVVKSGTKTGVVRRSEAKRTKQDWARLFEGVRGTITYEASLQDFTSFRIGGPAEVLVEPVDVDDLCRVVENAQRRTHLDFRVGRHECARS